MKRVLSTYLVKELLLSFFITFLFFFFIFFVNQLLLIAEDILSKKAPVHEVLLLIFYALPMIIATSAPFAALVGTLMALGRLVSEKEILSLQALGFSLKFIFTPVLFVGLLISLCSFITNDILLPMGTIRYHALYRQILTSTPALELEANSIKRNNNSILITGSINNDNVMNNLLVVETNKNGDKRIVSSSEVTIKKNDIPQVLFTLDLQNALYFTFSKTDKTNYDLLLANILSYNIFAKNLTSFSSSSISPREMSSKDLYKEIKEKLNQKDTKLLNMYKMEYHKKFSIPFGALFFVVIAFPLGLLSKSNGQNIGFIFGLVIAVIYWALLIGGQNLALRLNVNGPFLMWFPNVLMLFVGLVLMIKVIFQ